MNDIAKLLQQKAIKTASPLALPTMDDIIEAQEAILIHIPVEFRDYLLHCSDIIYGHLEPVTVADPRSHTYLPEVAADTWDRGMPREFVPLCTKGEGCYCVAEDGEVFFWRGDNSEPTLISTDVWQWVRDIWLQGNTES